MMGPWAKQALLLAAGLTAAVGVWAAVDLRDVAIARTAEAAALAQAKVRDLTVSSAYDLVTNILSLTWTFTYSGGARTVCDSNEGTDVTHGGDTVSTTSGTGYSYTSAKDFSPGGTRYFTVARHYHEEDDDDHCNIDRTETVYHGHAFPAKVKVTDVTYESDGDLAVTWTGPNYNYWKWAISQSGSSFSSVGSLASGGSTRSATIPASSVSVDSEKSYGLWAIGTDTATYTPTSSKRHYLRYSPRESFFTGPDCGDSDVVPMGDLYGSGHSVSGDFTTSPCGLEIGVPAVEPFSGSATGLLYSFQMNAARDSVDIVLTPETSFSSTAAGQYRMRLRSASRTGDDLGTVTGPETIRLDNLSLGAGITYIVEVMRWGTGGGTPFSLSLAYPYVERPTPTPAPTPTPRPLLNVDFRLEPDPSTQDYAPNQTYEFQFRGAGEKFPVQVRVGNSAALAVGDSASLTCDSDDATADDEAEFAAKTEVLYVRTCADSNGRNSTLEVSGGSDDELLARYALYIGYSALPTPEPAAVPMEWEQDRRGADGFGIGIIVSVVCQGLGVGCDLQLIQDGLWIAGAAVALIVPLAVPRGPASTGGWAVGITLAVAVLMVGVRTSGVSPWLLALSLLALFVLAALGIFRKFGSVRL